QWSELDRGIDRTDDRLGLRHVAVDVDATQLVGQLLATLTVEVGDDDLRATRSELTGGSLTDAGRAAGDQRRGVLQVEHVSIPSGLSSGPSRPACASPRTRSRLRARRRR